MSVCSRHQVKALLSLWEVLNYYPAKGKLLSCLHALPRYERPRLIVFLCSYRF